MGPRSRDRRSESGIDRLPAVFQPFIRALPLTAVVDALRGSMLQGAPARAGPSDRHHPRLGLVLSFFTALQLFRWR